MINHNWPPNFACFEFLISGGVPQVPENPMIVIPRLFALSWELQKIRHAHGMPIRIISGYRTPEHNLAVHGAQNSYHVRGMAADITSEDIEKLDSDIRRLTCSAYNIDLSVHDGGYHFYEKKGFIHYDIGPRRRWIHTYQV